MSVLGVGVRVYIKWAPPDKRIGVNVNANTGTITKGPYPSHYRFDNRHLGRYSMSETSWRVTLDDYVGKTAICGESTLTPITDGDPDEAERAIEIDAVGV